MSRLDNSNPECLEILRECGEKRWLKVKPFDDDDPGATPPMDVCRDCLHRHFVGIDYGEAEHPSYSDSDYRCAICGRELDEWRDR